jgi:hypothetical protein
MEEKRGKEQETGSLIWTGEIILQKKYHPVKTISCLAFYDLPPEPYQSKVFYIYLEM